MQNREVTAGEYQEYKELRKNSLYHTYIVNYYNEENEFDYFIFHSLTALNTLDEKSYKEISRQFKKLRRAEYGESEDFQIDQIIEYKFNNYPKFKK